MVYIIIYNKINNGVIIIIFFNISLIMKSVRKLLINLIMNSWVFFFYYSVL